MAQSQESIITTNWKRTQPSSHFGTRNLQWYYFSMDYNLYKDDTSNSDGAFGNGDGPVGYTEANSLYTELVKTIQEVAGSELYYLGAPTYQQVSEFVFAVADDDGQGLVTGPYQIGGQINGALENFFGGYNDWILIPMTDTGEGIFSL